MADFSYAPETGGEFYFDDGAPDVAPASNTLTNITNIAGALVSLSLVLGIGYWGYDLLKRDVSGIPVVRAIEGEMRVRPEDPGGQLAQNQGLSVNDVASAGTDVAPAQKLHLAPGAAALAEEDRPMAAETVASLPQGAAPSADLVAASLESGNVDTLVAQLTEGVTPIEDLSADANPVVAEVETSSVLSPDVPGVQVSLRPTLRPARRSVQVASLGGTELPASTAVEVDVASIAAGTRLVQLGAFDSPEIARQQWDKLATRFDVYLEGKKRVVQKATSGGRVFYRLRAVGFADIGDARRFCSALVAENADCIPVVAR